MFLFSGTPSVNPWDGNGHRGDAFMPDNYTFTPYGELYAAWDADRVLHPQTPYFIHNCATCFRATALRNVTGLAASSIRHEDATTQWIITNAPTFGHYYIQSLADGRRLRYSSSVLDLAPPGTTGATSEWSFNGPDSNSYYYIDNPNGSVSLSGSGSGGGISFTAVASGSPSDNTRWRFVKPYYPASLAGGDSAGRFERVCRGSQCHAALDEQCVALQCLSQHGFRQRLHQNQFRHQTKLLHRQFGGQRRDVLLCRHRARQFGK
jgi:hypothetical protein